MKYRSPAIAGTIGALAMLVLCAYLFMIYVAPKMAVESSAWAQAPANAATLRVGTFDSQSLVVGYYRSELHEKNLKAMRDEQAKAKAAGDKEKAQEIEYQGSASQDLAHKQLTGEARIDNILEALKERLPEVAKAANVDLIVEKPAYASERVEQVDVTDAIVAAMKVDQKTLDMIRQMRQDRKKQD